VLQSEVPSEAGSRTDELLTSITNICRQALESRIHLTSENNDKLSQIYNELRQLLSANEEMQLSPNINMQAQR
jgi:thiamine pyrophosphokinase